MGKLFAGCKLKGALAPNQCQIIAFLIFTTDITAKLRIEKVGVARGMLAITSKLLGSGGGGLAPLAPLFLRLCVFILINAIV